MTRLSSKNQVTLPVAALTEARIRPGDELRVEVEGDGRIVLIRDRDLLNEFEGSVPGLAAAETVEALVERLIDRVCDIDRDVATTAAGYRASHVFLRLPDALVLA